MRQLKVNRQFEFDSQTDGEIGALVRTTKNVGKGQRTGLNKSFTVVNRLTQARNQNIWSSQ